METAELGMWVFIATEILFFGGLFFAYLYGRTHWPDGFALASRRTDVLLGTINTAVLLTSSLAVALAVAAAEHDRRRWIAPLLWVTAARGVVFLVVKFTEYRHEWAEHLFPGAGFALATTALKSGAGAPQVIAYTIAWALFALQRVIIFEIPVMPARVVWLRVIVSLPLPFLGAWLAMLVGKP